MRDRHRAGPPAPWLAVLLLTSCLGTDPYGPAKDDLLFASPYLGAILKLPAGYDSARTYPLLVALHGNGGNASGFAPPFEPVARASYFVAIPQAPYARPDGGYSWFSLTTDRTLWEVDHPVSVRDVVALIDALRARYHIGAVYLLGFSQGASLAYMTGFLHPELLTGILAISGSLPAIDTVGAIVHAADVDGAAGLRAFVARGTGDGLVSRQSYLRQVDLLTGHGYAVTTYEFDGGHEVTGDVVGHALEWLRAGGRR